MHLNTFSTYFISRLERNQTCCILQSLSQSPPGIVHNKKKSESKDFQLEQEEKTIKDRQVIFESWTPGKLDQMKCRPRTFRHFFQTRFFIFAFLKEKAQHASIVSYYRFRRKKVFQCLNYKVTNKNCSHEFFISFLFLWFDTIR